MAGVQIAPGVLLAQAACVPTPGAIKVRSKVIGAATPWLNVMKPGTLVDPVEGPPVNERMVPPVNPAKEPVSRAPGVLTNVGLKRMLVRSTLTFPAMFACPDTAAARAEVALKSAVAARRPANREPLKFIIA